MAKPGRKPKKEVQESIQKQKENIFKDLEDSENNYNSIEDINIEDLVPNVFNSVIINIGDDGRHYLFLPDKMSGLAFYNWRNQTRGGVFSRDINNYCMNKKYGKYIIISKNKNIIIARIIEDEELESFKSNKLIDGKIIDKPYMILKTVKNKQKITTTDIYSDSDSNNLEFNEKELI